MYCIIIPDFYVCMHVYKSTSDSFYARAVWMHIFIDLRWTFMDLITYSFILVVLWTSVLFVHDDKWETTLIKDFIYIYIQNFQQDPAR